MSFLAFIIRGFSQLLKPNQQLIADSFINLLRDCPSETSAARKVTNGWFTKAAFHGNTHFYHSLQELMVATRHILTTDFRMSFIKYLEDGTLFNEDILVGVGMTSKITLRYDIGVTIFSSCGVLHPSSLTLLLYIVRWPIVCSPISSITCAMSSPPTSSRARCACTPSICTTRVLRRICRPCVQSFCLI